MRAEELSLRATVPPAQVPGYKLERMLGQGAFGQVWVGTNLNTGRTVAVKFYLHRGGVNWSLLSREVKNLVSMAGNRLIVQVLEVGWDAEPPYYVMEYLENGSLDELIRKRGQIPLHEAVALFTDIARGLNHSHGKGVLHCDLKPANVLLDPDMQPRLADFGQSRLTNEQTPSLGTLFYMAPEQADLNAVPDARWDVYALGAILYCMLVGTPPYRTPDTVTTLDTATSLEERLKRYRDTIYKTHFPKAHHRVPRMDRWLSAIIDRCLAKKPDDRFENVEQVLEAVERRNMARLNMPLKLLGIVGPILLLAVMSLFFWRGVGVAERESSTELKEMVLKNNLFAARLGARTMEKEIESLFELVEKEAAGSSLKEFFQQTLSDIGQELQVALRGNASEDRRQNLIQLAARRELESYLTNRFNALGTASSIRSKIPKYDSLFLTDKYGTMIAWTSSDPSAIPRVGGNFAYRNYFNGRPEDADQNQPAREFRPIQYSHLSSPFLSTTTNRWKIAVSTPVVQKTTTEESAEDAPPPEILGVLVLTIQLGDLDLLPADMPSTEETAPSDSTKSPGTDRLAVLVDGHKSSAAEQVEGTILQHPGLSKLPPQESKNKKDTFRIDLEQLSRLKREGTSIYQDPLAQHPNGEAYKGNWIAAMSRVDVSNKSNDSDSKTESTNLWVLVQARADAVTAPVARMASQMIREGIAALLILVTMVLSLWAIVVWVMRLPESFRAVVRSRIASKGELTNSTDEATLDVDR
jgi:eukaryotic-like serine/threonine-protein kinase